MYERAASIKRGEIDLNTGAFPVVVATNGEASDGHIIDLKGLEIGERTPLFVNHNANPIERMGHLHSPHLSGKQTQLGGGRLHMIGVIDLTGDGQWPDIRRDVAGGIHNGDITGSSIRWDEIDTPIPRAMLAKNHYAYSTAGESSFNTPMFFPSSRLLENSIVGIGSDPGALMGRSQDESKPQHVRDFYSSLVNGPPLSRERMLEQLYEMGGQIEGLIEVDSESAGKVFVPREYAPTALETDAESIEDDDFTIDELVKIDAAEAVIDDEADSQEASEPETTRSVEPEPLPVESVRTHAYAQEVQAIERGADERYNAAVALAHKQLRYLHLGTP